MTFSKIPVPLRLLVVLALAGLLVWQALVLRTDRRDDDRLADAVAVAKAQVLDITTLDSDTVDAKLQAMSERTSGDFKDQVTAIAETFIKIVREKKIKVVGRIDGAGASSSSGRDATVLVASTAIVTESGKATPTTRTYRIRVNLARSGGAWKINGMEFVQ